MPGYRPRNLYLRCPQCDGADVTGVGEALILHHPWCPTQPNHEAEWKKHQEAQVSRRQEIDAMVADPEVQRRLALRQARRLGED